MQMVTKTKKTQEKGTLNCFLHDPIIIIPKTPAIVDIIILYLQ